MKNILYVFKVKFFSFSLLLLCISHFSFSQIITTIAGCDSGGYSGDGGPATQAELGGVTGVAVDGLGNVYIADETNSRVRMVNTTGIIETFAGNGIGAWSGDDGPATAAEIFGPWAVAIGGSRNVYIVDEPDDVVRMVNPDNIISRFAGDGSPFGYGGDGGPASVAQLRWPTGVAVDGDGNVYIADQFNNRVRKVNMTGIISTIAGNDDFNGYSGDGGLATEAEINQPAGVGVDVTGNVYFADVGNERIRKINTAGIISTIAGNGVAGFWGDGGRATDAELNGPIYVEADAYGDIYISEVINNRIRKVNSSGIITTIVGNGTAGFSGDGGSATAAEINKPHGIALDASGNLYIADQYNTRIRKITDVAGINEVVHITGVNLFPNPNNGMFTLLLSNFNEPCNITIYNVIGQKVYTTTFPTPIGGGASIFSTQIDLSFVSSGMYLYRVLSQSGNPVGEGKLIIQK